jgi:pimeloyl-ACP methyl ester carboxylesterase
MWEPQLGWLPASTVAPILYGFGRSIEEWADAVLDRVGGEHLVLVGGFCALEMARRRPEQVDALVLVGAKAGVRRDPAGRDRTIDLVTGNSPDHGWRLLWAPMFGPNASPTVIERARSLAAETPVDLLVNGLEAFYERPDLSTFARTWRKPLVMISGEHDRTPSPTVAAAVAAQAPGGRFHLVANCGHYVNLEQPSAFDNILRAVISAEHGYQAVGESAAT